MYFAGKYLGSDHRIKSFSVNTAFCEMFNIKWPQMGSARLTAFGTLSNSKNDDVSEKQFFKREEA